MTVKKTSALTWVGWIAGLTLAFELLVMVLGAGFSLKVLVRLLILGALFALLLRGSRFARYALGVLYLAGGLFSLVALLSPEANLLMAAFLLPFGVFGLAAAGFFFRSKGLRAWASAYRQQVSTDRG